MKEWATGLRAEGARKAGWGWAGAGGVPRTGDAVGRGGVWGAETEMALSRALLCKKEVELVLEVWAVVGVGTVGEGARVW